MAEDRLTAAFERIAVALERLADRLDADSKVFNGMVEAGRNVAVPSVDPAPHRH